MVTRIAAYGLSADPITFGHINLIERISRLYDEVLVVIAVNPSKTAIFSISEKEVTVKDAVSHLSNVSVHVCVGEYLASYAFSLGARVIVRGLRNSRDFEDEETLAEENRNICKEVETLWVPCLPSLAHISSSVVKGHVGADSSWEKQVVRLVPKSVLKLLAQKYYEKCATKHWVALMDSLGNPSGNKMLLDKLFARYREPHRFYHTLKHVISMLDEFEEVSHLAENLNRVRLAIWYHDAYQDTSSESIHMASNEERSAELARGELASLGCNQVFIDGVCDMIQYTNHQKKPNDTDTQLFLDLDLAILGQNDEVYDEYKGDVRKEYAWVKEGVYATERIKILRRILERGQIYFMGYFYERLERKAQENLRREIEELSL